MSHMSIRSLESSDMGTCRLPSGTSPSVRPLRPTAWQGGAGVDGWVGVVREGGAGVAGWVGHTQERAEQEGRWSQTGESGNNEVGGQRAVVADRAPHNTTLHHLPPSKHHHSPPPRTPTRRWPRPRLPWGCLRGPAPHRARAQTWRASACAALPRKRPPTRPAAACARCRGRETRTPPPPPCASSLQRRRTRVQCIECDALVEQCGRLATID